MTLAESYAEVRKSIVAFVPRWRRKVDGKAPKTYPPIIGTGFVVGADGVVVTNEHVVRELLKLERPAGVSKTDFPAMALLYHLADGGQYELPLTILGLAGIEEYEDRGYGAKPDIAIVHVKARGLPALQVDSEFPISEGIELATAGFPMGRDALTAPGWLHQITPTVQRGIVSASLPFPGAPLHGFTLNVMVQGGASGSPVFNPNTAAVVGLLYGSLTEWERTMHGGRIPIPTNISYVAPAHVIKRFIDEIERDNRFPAPNDAKTIEERVTTGQIVDRYEEMDIGNVRRASR
jgi:S1-C subfamily serine protease